MHIWGKVLATVREELYRQLSESAVNRWVRDLSTASWVLEIYIRVRALSAAGWVLFQQLGIALSTADWEFILQQDVTSMYLWVRALPTSGWVLYLQLVLARFTAKWILYLQLCESSISSAAGWGLYLQLGKSSRYKWMRTFPTERWDFHLQQGRALTTVGWEKYLLWTGARSTAGGRALTTAVGELYPQLVESSFCWESWVRALSNCRTLSTAG